MTANGQSTAPVTIDVVSDVVCPWCFLGKRHLEAALADLPEIAATVRWRPFQLDPTVPPEGIERDAYIAQRFGDRARFAAAEERLLTMGRAAGLDYRFDLIRRTPNTIDAHRLVRWAGAIGREADIVERLFNLYFIEGADVGDHAVLADAGAAVGLDREETLKRLSGEEDRAAIVEEIAAAQRIGVTGVPTFILIGRYGLAGAQPKEAMVEAIRRAAAEANAATPAA